MLFSSQVDYKTFHMNIIDTEKFEEKLRKAESNLGIRPETAVQVVYERNQDSAWLILGSLVLVSLMILMMFRTGHIKTPQGMDIFVRICCSMCY